MADFCTNHWGNPAEDVNQLSSTIVYNKQDSHTGDTLLNAFLVLLMLILYTGRMQMSQFYSTQIIAFLFLN